MLLKTTREIIGLNYHALSLKAVSCVQLVRAFSGHPSIFLILFLLGSDYTHRYVPTTTYGYRFYGAPNCTFSEQPLYGSFHSAEL